MKAINKIMNFFEVTVCNIFFIAMCALVIVQILLRTFGLPLSWTEEIARYLFVWIVYLACSRALANGNHLSVDIITLFLKGRAAAILAVFVDLIITFFVVFIIYNGFGLISKMFITPQYSAAVGIPMVIPYAAPVFGSILMCIRVLEKIVHDIKNVLHPDCNLSEIEKEGLV